MIKRKMRLVGYVACMIQNMNAYKVLVRNRQEDLDVDVGERIILKYIFKKQDGVV
jgi:hypothetical protein